MSVRSKFLFLFLATAILPLILLAMFIFGSVRDNVTKDTEATIQNHALFKEGRSGIVIDALVEKTQIVANNADVRKSVDAYLKGETAEKQRDLNDALVNIAQNFSEVKSVSIISTAQQIIASSDSSLIGVRDQVREKKVAFNVEDGKLPSISIQEPITLNNTTIGTIQLVAQGGQTASLVGDYSGLGTTGDNLFIQEKAGGLMAVSSSRFSKDDDVPQELRDQLVSMGAADALKNHSNASGVATVSDKSFVYALRYIPALDAAYVTKIDTSEALQTVDHLRDGILLFALIFSLLATMIILFFVHSITGPISNLATVARATVGGNLGGRALVLSKDELGDLAKAFNFMLDDLQDLKSGLEKKVQERTKQLEMTNKDLESFSYSVSHDLRAPLRAIDGFSRILEEDYSKKLDEDGKRTLNTIIESTKQMGRLIDDLLAFSRLGRQEVKKQEIDMSVLANEVYDELKRQYPDRDIDFRIKKLPSAYADASLMRQVWINYLSNAIKFTRNNPNAVIEVSAKGDDDSVTYYIKDNGAGFDMAYANKLFGVFQRLHAQKDFEGTGVGLAIVKRVVDRHGGTVSAKAEVNKGATVSFTLPKSHNQKRRHHHDKK